MVFIGLLSLFMDIINLHQTKVVAESLFIATELALCEPAQSSFYFLNGPAERPYFSPLMFNFFFAYSENVSVSSSLLRVIVGVSLLSTHARQACSSRMISSDSSHTYSFSWIFSLPAHMFPTIADIPGDGKGCKGLETNLLLSHSDAVKHPLSAARLRLLYELMIEVNKNLPTGMR
jgi:hypothetical protein